MTAQLKFGVLALLGTRSGWATRHPRALGQVAPDLLAAAPDIRTVDVIAAK